MAFRSHVTRSLDLRLRSNQIAVAITLAAGAIAAALVLLDDRSPWLIVYAGGATFIAWAIARELDPDRTLTATLSGLASAAWALTGNGVALLPLAALIFIPRLIVESSGRRPLTTDLVAIGVFGAAISFTPAGWVAGFGIGLAIYLDNRIAERKHAYATVIALGTAIAATVMATLTQAFPQEVPEIQPVLALGLGALAIVAALREPPDPVSQVDARRKSFLLAERLHAGRTVTALILFGAVLLSGPDGAALVPAGFALALSLVSSEMERIQRTR